MLSLKSTITVYLSLKFMAWKHTRYYVNKSDIGRTRLKQQ